ncbi:tail fiber domain-containing protein [Paracoccus litorisediminis]|uniref:tail fiber domain-containing protein n=1 Tax=Paracoccus litorisediminis TaxID=2006130 RepID=UPI00372F05FA
MIKGKAKLLLGVVLAGFLAGPALAQSQDLGGALIDPGFSGETGGGTYSATAGDNLGNHIAEQHLNMSGNGIYNLRDIDASSRADQGVNKKYVDQMTKDDASIVRTTNIDQAISGNKSFSRPVTIPSAPTSNTHATSKSYVDGLVGGLDGRVSTIEGNYVTTTGNQTITGNKTFSGTTQVTNAPTAANHVVNKSYVDGAYSGGSGIDVTNRVIATDATVVRTSGAQTIGGAKTFSSNITGSGGISTTTFADIGTWINAGGGITAGTSLNSTGNTNVGAALSVTNGGTFGGNVNIGGNLNMLNGKIQNLATPTANTDATTKAYVDAVFRTVPTALVGGVAYSGTTPTLGEFHGGGTGPVFSTANPVGPYLNYNGYFRAPRFYSQMYLYYSDRSLKKDIVPIAADAGMEIVRGLEPVSYSWKANDEKALGVIAQQVEMVMPSAVKTEEGGLKAVDYQQMIAPMLAAIQQLDDRVAELEAEVAELKAAN